MKKEWFEPGPDGKSPFTKLYRKSMDDGLLVSESISAAFLALLSAEVQEPAALQVGDVVRLERYEDTEDMGWLESESHLIGSLATINFFDDYGHPYLQIKGQPSVFWLYDACTLIRRAGEVDRRIGLVDRRFISCNDSLEARIAVGREHTRVFHTSDDDCEGTVVCARSNCRRRAGEPAPVDAAGLIHDRKIAEEQVEAKDAEIARLTAERDEARRAMIEAKAQRDELHGKLESRTRDRNLYAQGCATKDAEIARLQSELHARNDEIVGLRAEVERWKSIADPGKMVDERKGKADRRETSYTKAFGSGGWIKRDDKGRQGIIGCFGDVAHARSNDRRRAAGTRADRGQA